MSKKPISRPIFYLTSHVEKWMLLSLLAMMMSCQNQNSEKQIKTNIKSMVTANDILGNAQYPAICYGGYRTVTRDDQPTLTQIKDDMLLLSAMGIKVVRTYHTKLRHATTVLEAIHDIKKEHSDFEMYVMLGAWIDCRDAWTDHPNHDDENAEENMAEVQRAVNLAKEYPDIVKIIAVGNEAMVKWAATYYVQPWVILKYVNHLQELKSKGELSQDIWITSSDNFASWGGGDSVYHVEDLNKLIKAVDYISLHTYPMHDTHYNPSFWGIDPVEQELSRADQIEKTMERAVDYARRQFGSTKAYIHSIDNGKEVHIGETGWASTSNGLYGPDGSKATDEYKEALYYRAMRQWTDDNDISCFYFEAFDEPWKDAQNQGGSENHFGLFTVEGKAKYALWPIVDQGVFEKLSRDGKPITKTYDGNIDELIKDVDVPPVNAELTSS